MALPLSKLAISKNAPILKCIKGRNIAFWTKKAPVFKTVKWNDHGSCRDFSVQRLKPIFSWPQMMAKAIRVEKPKKQCLSLQKSASCSTIGAKRPTDHTNSVHRSRSAVNLRVTRACSKKNQDQDFQEQMPMPMGPCNCPWPGGCPPPGFMQGNPCAMGMGGCCAPPCQGPPGIPNMPNMQCPCCGAPQGQASGPCAPFGACGACAVPPGMMGGMPQGMQGMPGGMPCGMPGCMAGGMPGMPGGMPGGMPPGMQVPPGMQNAMQGAMPAGMPPMGACGTWGPCGGPMCAQGVPCPFPTPCHSANEQQAESKASPKKDN
ncbi:hypothetical protein O0L34_g12926 [Tuta absoluta]|nr:hypothetical protein O0L34_g12926 [Tuta absoluta]